MYWLQDELHTGLLQGVDDHQKIRVFETLLEGDDRVRVNNKILALDGKNAAITELQCAMLFAESVGQQSQ